MAQPKKKGAQLSLGIEWTEDRLRWNDDITGLPVGGVVLADQAKSLDWRARRAELACTLPPESTAAVLQRIETLARP